MSQNTQRPGSPLVSIPQLGIKPVQGSEVKITGYPTMTPHVVLGGDVYA
ncbi:hypothetical protein ES703_94502 [subsurface metagenome]